MTNKSKSPNPKIGDEALKAKTGKTWKEWFAALDKAGANKMSHSEIADYLYEKLKVPGWWNQMVAVTYEQVRGLRQKYEKPEGYEISVSKVIPVPLSSLYKSWMDEKVRNSWLKEKGMVVRKATPNKSIRAAWNDKKTRLEVNFYAKGSSKSQVVVQHAKLGNMSQAEKMKKYWKEKLEKLDAALEKS